MKAKTEPTYPDTAKGAIEALEDMSTYVIKKVISTRPDPVVHGVWEVVFDDGVHKEEKVCVVYLAGYKDPWGIIRQHDDFETLDLVK